MRLLFGIGHPAHVHFFRNLIDILESQNHEIQICVNDRENVQQMLKLYEYSYEVYGNNHPNMHLKILDLLKYERYAYNKFTSFRPHLVLSIAHYFFGHVGKFLNVPSMYFTDTEDARLINSIGFPFADLILTPSCFQGSVPLQKHISYNSYHELAYLHPDIFKPDPSVLHNLNVNEGDKFILVRFSSWDSSHDIGHMGFKSLNERIQMIKELEKYGKVFITSEIDLPEDLHKNRCKISPEKIHDLLYYSQMYIGEGATLASEAGVLGVPWVWISAGERRGYLDDQENHYGLGFSLDTPQAALKKSIELLTKEITSI